MQKVFFTMVVLQILFHLGASSQGTTSPYSLFGLGSVEGNSIGVSSAMGGTGISSLSSGTLNLVNPASYGGLDSLYSLFEIGFFANYTNYKSYDTRQALFNANPSYVAMGFRVSRRFATSFGIVPYSSVGYKINSSSEIKSSNLMYNKSFTGEGGINKLYLGGAYSLSNNLYLGINAAYLFGNIDHSESSESMGYSFSELTSISSLVLNWGLIYRITGKNSFKYNIGLVYDKGKDMITRSTSRIITTSETNELDSYTNNLKIPGTKGIGFSVEKGYFRGSIDYKNQNWKGISFNNPLLETRNSNRYSAGIEFPSLGIKKGSSKMIYYRFGAEYCDSYLKISGIPIVYRAVTFGAGLPLKGVSNVVNLSIELGKNGTMRTGLFKETFCTFRIDLSLKEIWFMKAKYM